MQELGQFRLEINVIPNRLEKYKSFSINNVLDLVKRKGFYPYEYMTDEYMTYEYMTDFKKFKEQLPSKEKFYISLTGKIISNKEYDHALKI